MVAEPSTSGDVERDTSEDRRHATQPEPDRDENHNLLGSWDTGERDRVKMAIVSVLALGGLAYAGATTPQIAYVGGGVILLNGLAVDGVHQRIPHLRLTATVLMLAFLGGVAVLWPSLERTALGLATLFLAGTVAGGLARQSTP